MQSTSDRPGKRRAGVLGLLVLPLALPLLVFSSLACGDPTGPGDPPEEITNLPRSLTVAETDALGSANAFGLEMVSRLHAGREEGEANVFISPLSASMALAMAMNGADGETLSAMRDVLGFGELTLEEANDAYASLSELLLGLDPSVEFGLANSVWIDEGYSVQTGYRSRVEEAFDARIENVDFEDSAVAGEINAWVEEGTEGRITDLVTPESIREIIALLVNTVYFEGSWTHEFDPEATATVDFRRPDGSTVGVPLMERTVEEDGRIATSIDGSGGYYAADLPYGGQAFSMTVVVPAGETTLDDLVAEIDAAWWGDLIGSLEEREFHVFLPRFELTYEKVLNDVLKAMGMAVAFDEMEADFSRLVEGPLPGNLFIDRVRQKSFIRVDEEGTEAAAATSVTIMPTSAPPTVRADRPFLFAIRERLSGTILFVGTMTDPTAEG